MQMISFRKYPSITALQCFESSARHSSFTKAGKELHMTQSAVSKQIAQLEELLDLQLFYRTNQGLHLSDVGQSYYIETINILKHIENATLNMLVKKQEGEVLNITSHPTFCSKWLIPALKGFGNAHPNIHLNIKEQSEPILDNDDMDIAFAFGDGIWVNMDSIRLFDECMIAVCQPGYTPKTLTVAELSQYPLLQISSRPNAWHEYFSQHNYQYKQALMGAKFDTFYACINAAMIGCGIALVPKRFVTQELLENTLMQALPNEISSNNAYYMAYQSRLAHTSKVKILTTWIKNYIETQEKNS